MLPQIKKNYLGNFTDVKNSAASLQHILIRNVNGNKGL